MGRPTTVRRDPNYLGPAIEVPIEELHEYERKGGWIIEPKYDGMFASFTAGNPAEGRLHVLNSRDARTPPITGTSSGDLRQLLMPEIPEGTVLAGELEAATQWSTNIVAKRGYRQFHVFDVLQIGDKNLRNLPLIARKRALQDLLTVDNELLRSRFQEVAFAPNRFEDRYRKWIAAGCEGVVLKQAHSLYKTKSLDGKTNAWRRCKKTYTQDYVLCGLTWTPGGEGGIPQLTGLWGLYVKGKLTKVLQAFAPRELLTEDNVGKLVVEFSGWALFRSGALRHAQFSRVRTDKFADSCVLPQFTEE